MSDLKRVVELGEELVAAQQALDQIRARYAMEWARYYYGGCTDVRGSHPILERLGYDRPVVGLRQDRYGALVVPAFLDTGQMGTLIKVLPDGSHQHIEGASLAPTSYELNHRTADMTVVTPDVQDALLCYRVLTNARVFVSFTEWNASRIAKRLHGMVCLTLEPWADLWQERVQVAEANRGSHKTPGQCRRDVDEWLRAELMRATKFVAKPIGAD